MRRKHRKNFVYLSVRYIAKPGEAPKNGIDGYRFGFNGIEKVNEVAGLGNHYTALFGEYNPRIAYRWNTDPKANPWESPYAMFGGNPILNSDVLLDRWRNMHERANTAALDKKNELQGAVANYQGDKSSKEFAKLNKKLGKAEREYTRINERYMAAENALRDLEIHNNKLYNDIENLQDPLGNNVDVYVGIQEGLFSDVFGGGGMNDFMNRKKLDGITDVNPYGRSVSLGDATTGESIDVFSIASRFYGRNTAVILIDASVISKGRVLSHEGGHVKYSVGNMAAYQRWLRANPGKSEGGHGGGNPSGAAADVEEENYR